MNKRTDFLIVDTESNFIDFRKVDAALHLIKAINTKTISCYTRIGDEFFVKISDSGHFCLANDNTYIYSLTGDNYKYSSFADFWQMMRSHFKFYVVK